MIDATFKTPIQTRLGICVIKLHFHIDPMTVLVSHQAVLQQFITKLRHVVNRLITLDSLNCNSDTFLLRVLVLAPM